MTVNILVGLFESAHNANVPRRLRLKKYQIIAMNYAKVKFNCPLFKMSLTLCEGYNKHYIKANKYIRFFIPTVTRTVV